MQLNLKGKIIGELEDGWLIKKGKQAVLFRNEDGFAVAKEALDLVEKGVVVCYEGMLYRATKDDFKHHGKTVNHADYEPQSVLARKFWQKSNPNQTSML